MKMQSKSAGKFVISMLLVAAVLLTYCFGCTFSVAYADDVETQAGTHVVTYKWAVEDGAYQTKSTESVQYAYALNFPKMDDVRWFKFDGWYTDQARTEKATSMLNVESDLTLYGAYVLSVGTGDVNADGIVNIDDISLYRKYIVGGYDMEIVPSGGEWDIVKSGGSYSASKTYFLERVAGISDTSILDMRDVTQIRMAIAGGYGIDVYDSGIFQSHTVYFHNEDGWTAPHVYFWNKYGSDYTWPGLPMEPVSDKAGWYSAQIPDNARNVIFNGNNGTEQTVDLTFDADLPFYGYGDWHSNYPTTKTVYFHNRHSWSQPYAHHWQEGGATTEWPGVTMSSVAGFSGWYSVEIPIERDSIIFHDNSDQNATLDYKHKTFDLTLDDGNRAFYNGEWVDSPAAVTYSTIYYYNPAISVAYAYYWGNGSNSWPGTQMTPVSGEVGLFSIDVPMKMTSIQFNGGGDDSKYADNLTINRNSSCYSQYGDWYDLDNYFVYVKVGDETFKMIPQGDDYTGALTRDDGQYMLRHLYLEAGQHVEVWRFDSKSGYEYGCVLSSGVVGETGYYDFYCKKASTWVGKS